MFTILNLNLDAVLNKVEPLLFKFVFRFIRPFLTTTAFYCFTLLAIVWSKDLCGELTYKIRKVTDGFRSQN